MLLPYFFTDHAANTANHVLPDTVVYRKFARFMRREIEFIRILEDKSAFYKTDLLTFSDKRESDPIQPYIQPTFMLDKNRRLCYNENDEITRKTELSLS